MTANSVAVAALRAYAPASDTQQRLRGRYLDHLAAHPDGLERGCQPDHLTVGALVINASRDRVLLNLHGKAHRWFHFGGHLEAADEGPAEGAAREVREESGLTDFRLSAGIVQLSEHVVPFCADRPDTHHLDVRYVAVAPDDSVPAVSEESVEVRWFALDGLPDLEPEMHELILAAVSINV